VMAIALQRRPAAHDEAHRRDGEEVAVGSMDIKRRASSHRAVDAHQPAGALRHQPRRPVTNGKKRRCLVSRAQIVSSRGDNSIGGVHSMHRAHRGPRRPSRAPVDPVNHN